MHRANGQIKILLETFVFQYVTATRVHFHPPDHLPSLVVIACFVFFYVWQNEQSNYQIHFHSFPSCRKSPITKTNYIEISASKSFVIN